MLGTRKLCLRPGPEGLAQARRALAGLEHEIDAGLFFDISLCVNELATNAMRAMESGPEAVELEVSLAGDSVLAMIRDEGSGARRLERMLEEEQDTDLGLYIISRLAHRWGVDRLDNVIWLEFQVTDRSLPREKAFTEAQAGRAG